MIKMHVARTSEIDELDIAMEEIKSQIDFSMLKKNSGGVIFCHIEFVESGLVTELCNALPFDVIGMTSMAGACENGYGLYDLTLTILTSDEVSFSAGMTQGINKANYVDEIDNLYKNIRGNVAEDPGLILSFMPYIRDVSGYEVVKAMDKAVSGIPIWGSITNNIDFNYETVQTICNGEYLSSGVAMMFLNGPVNPKFIVSSIPERNISNNRAIITKSEGSILREVNDMPILEYLKDIGLIITKENITTTPLMVYYDGAVEPVALGFYTLFEDGSVLTGGELPEGTSFAVGSIDTEGIFESTELGLNEILTNPERHATLLLPCVTRYIMLAPNQEGELKLITEKLKASGQPFMMGYSGGEICPMQGVDGKLYNRFHNYTFCACVL
ncbi:MAG: FIST C-terminal domain-containing protein [Defluviitaleaceae bacterium]|nr:FIST C-terminal domain-containing protein [Defluviitaleaceae bacterium]